MTARVAVAVFGVQLLTINLNINLPASTGIATPLDTGIGHISRWWVDRGMRGRRR